MVWEIISILYTTTSDCRAVVLVKDIKLASSAFIKEKNLFNDSSGWQEGYGAFTYSIREKERLVAYVNNQEKHHKEISCKDEYIELLNENIVRFDDKYV
jgi:putative transposase